MSDTIRDRAFIVFSGSLGVFLALSIALGVGQCIDHNREIERACVKAGGHITTIGQHRACVKTNPIVP